MTSNHLAEFLVGRERSGTTARGTIDLINPESVLRAIAEVRFGRVISLGRPIDSEVVGHEAEHRVLELPSGVEGCIDWFGIACHGFEVTHLDAVGHSALNGVMFGGVSVIDGISAQRGLLSHSIEDLASGFVMRGVFLDVAAARGVDFLPRGAHITAGDLELAERWANARVQRGDAIFVRSGAHADGQAPRQADSMREGLSFDAVEWIRDRDVALYSGDVIERLPSVVSGLPMPLHQLGHVGLGLAILDNPNVELLRDCCLEFERSSFLLVVSPLPLRRGSGSPVNPLVVF